MHLAGERRTSTSDWLAAGEDERGARDDPPQLARHHDGYAITHGLGLLHVVRR